MSNLSDRIAPLFAPLRHATAPGLPGFKAMARARLDDMADEHIPPLLPRLVIPMRDKTEHLQAYNKHFEQGQFLSRQENWAELGQLIRTFDKQRVMTPGGIPVADVLAAGARSDAVRAGVEAVARIDEVGARMPMNALQEVMEDNSEDHGVALVVARAHVDMAWAWSGYRRNGTITPVQKGAFHAHFRAAARIIDRFDAFELDAPTLAATRCALLAGERNPKGRVADDYEDLIDLAPENPKHMRRLGLHLLPEWFGSYETLDLQARRTTERTRDLWGMGAYCWVYLDALSVDDRAFDGMDADLFVQAMHDILVRRADQHTANLFAAFTGHMLSGFSEPNSPRERIAACFDWIVHDHLREVHPLVWMVNAGTLHPPAQLAQDREKQKPGRVCALSTLAEHFAPEIRKGNRVVFGETGVTITPCA